MKTENWIEHLDKPLILFGFILVIISGFVALFKTKKLSGSATERLMRLGMWLSFVIGTLVIGATLIQDYFDMETTAILEANNNEGKVFQAVGNITIGTSPDPLINKISPINKIKQSATGNKQPIYQAGGNIHVSP